MHTRLIFPPGWQHLQLPYLALPALTAYLKARGCTVSQQDLNIAFFHHLCDEAAYADLYARGQARFWHLNQQESLSAIGQAAYADLAWMVLQPPECFHERLLKARADLRGENFYHVTSCWAAVQTVNDLWGIVRALQTGLHLTAANARVQYLEESSAEILATVKAAQRNLHWNYYCQEFLPTIETQRPDLVGISIADPHQLVPALTLGRLLKEQVGVQHVTIGGNVPTRLRSIWPQQPEFFTCFDSVILYEGEGPLLALVEALANGDDLNRVPNLIYRQGTSLCTTELSQPVPIDELPAPDFEGLPLHDYLAPEIVLPLQTSRGCYWGRCAFCNFDKGVSRYQVRAPEQVVNDLSTLATRHGVRLFSLVDDALRPQPTEALADQILKSNLAVVWEGSARFDRHWTDVRCRKLAQAGCRTLSFGLESANERVLRLMNKGTERETVLEVLENCAAAGIINRVSLFFGFPSETLSEAQETLDFILAHDHLIHGVDGQRYTISRCSPVAESPARFDVTITQDDYKDMALRYYTYDTLGGMSRAESRAFSLQLYRETQARHPRLAITYYPVLLYASHFKTSDPLALVTPSQQPRSQQGEEEARTTHVMEPRLRRDVACVTLAYDLAAIRHRLNEGYEEVEPVWPAETQLIVDAGKRRVYTLPPLAASVLQAADGTKSLDAIAAAVAGRFGLSTDQAQSKCSALFQIYGSLLTQEPVRKGSENAHRVSVPA